LIGFRYTKFRKTSDAITPLKRIYE